MNSHEYANKLKGLAEFLLSKPAFNTPWSDDTAYTSFYYWTGSKDDFVAAARSLGSGEKIWSKDYLTFIPAATDMLKLQISRSSVCRLVREAEYECEPILSDEEVAQVGA